jgi:LuxR family transcriptional regulator, maltose regulon positive regulatory protein
MAERMKGNSMSIRLLEELYRAHLFVDRRSGTEPVYQFHALLGAFLQHRAAGILDVAEVKHAAVSAARLLEESGSPEDAVPLYLAGGDIESASTLVLKEAKQRIAQGRWQVVVDWIISLPSTVASQNWPLTPEQPGRFWSKHSN